MKTYRIEITGRIQGVGFRPFIYRLATKHRLSGTVLNDNTGVTIKINCSPDELDRFIEDIKTSAPAISKINSVKSIIEDPRKFEEFTIIESQDKSKEVTEISPDIAVCSDCLHDLEHQSHRINYPLTNCTNCGPRYSIIKAIPYDRNKTTMSVFPMCGICSSEYNDISNRRFHAQPVACNNCGPVYSLVSGQVQNMQINEIIDFASQLIMNNQIIALKGVGGYQLICNAENNNAVAVLRERKKRDSKPFGVMFRNIETLKQYARVNKDEEQILVSWQRPIVLLNQTNTLCEELNKGLKTIGAILPYMPFHYMLFKKISIPAVVFTSGNYSNEPIIKDDDEAIQKLLGIADGIISYNREIENRCDDSIIFGEKSTKFISRRSRGFVPESIKTGLNVDGILATGGELKNTFSLGKEKNALMSPYIGDLEHLKAIGFFKQQLKHYQQIFRVNPTLMVHDLHPDYFTTRFALESGLECISVQHHHAHIASVLAEHQLDEEVIGFALDGTGYGADGKIWGSEIMIAGLSGFIRKYHFEYLPLPGGESAIKEPWKIALAVLIKIYGSNFKMNEFRFLDNIPNQNKNIVLQAVHSDINITESCGAGRYFDTAAALLNICSHNHYEAEAPMRLESIIHPEIHDFYPIRTNDKIEMIEVFKFITDDLTNSVPATVISAKFHNTIVHLLKICAESIRNEYGIKKVVLSGGTFQNRYILRNILEQLRKLNFEVFTNTQVPLNDGGLSLGQLAIAAKRRNKECV